MARHEIVAGVDEVGRGCLAGPVYAGAVILDYDRYYQLPRHERNLFQDSKALTKEQRAEAVPHIHKVAKAFATASATVKEIERINIIQASFLAMRRALRKLNADFDILLVDGKLEVSGYRGVQRCVVGGDAICLAIAAASILAKEARDARMKRLAKQYPGYGFESHVGYATPFHRKKLKELGACKIHRRTYAPVKAALMPTDLKPLFDPDGESSPRI